MKCLQAKNLFEFLITYVTFSCTGFILAYDIAVVY